MNDVKYRFFTVMDTFYVALVSHFNNQILWDKLVRRVEEFMVIARSFCYDLVSRMFSGKERSLARRPKRRVRKLGTETGR